MLKSFTRRNFLKAVTATAVGTWFLNTFPALAEASSNEIQYVRQIITKNISKSRTIMWQTAKPHPEARLHYRLENGPATSIQPVMEEFVDDNHTTFIYSVSLDELKRGESYQYKITCNTSETPWYSLTTPHENDSFTALIFPDSQCSDGYITWRNVAHNAYRQHPNANFMVSMGDLVDNGEASWQWTQWQDGINELWKAIPFAPVMGNHETYNLNWLCRLPKAYLALFNLPDNQSQNFKDYYYSYDVGPVHFTVLNTMWDELHGLNDGIITEQIEWLKKDISHTDKKWKVVLMHKDVIFYDDPDALRSPAYPKNNPVIGAPYENTDELPETTSLIDIDEVGRIFMPHLDKLKIDAVLTAHQHTYRRHNHIYDFKPSKDKGPVYFCTGIAGNVRYNVAFTRRFDQKFIAQPETENYMTLTADDEKLLFRCYLTNGKLVDEYILEK